MRALRSTHVSRARPRESCSSPTGGQTQSPAGINLTASTDAGTGVSRDPPRGPRASATPVNATLGIDVDCAPTLAASGSDEFALAKMTALAGNAAVHRASRATCATEHLQTWRRGSVVLPQSREAAESGSAGGCAVLRSRPPARLASELEAGANVHHRRASRVDRADDLLDASTSIPCR